MVNITSILPKDGFAGLKENFAIDAISGFLVFLLAMPLSLGIASASGFPPVMGLLTAIVGGLVVSTIAGSRLTIKGPAAGLIVIVADAVTDLGEGNNILGWKLVLGVIVVTGVFQVLLGVLKLGSLSDFFPSAVVHGMLAAIGIIVFAKQIHLVLGINPDELKGMGTVRQLLYIPHSLMNIKPHIAIIGLGSLIIIFGLPQIKNEIIRRIPSPLVVLVFAIPVGLYFDFKVTEPEFALVQIGNFFQDFAVNVSFDGFDKPLIFIRYVIMFSLVGSIESLLTVKAIDNLDPYKRKSNYNKDLMAIGAGNILAGVFGGLPMISEVARSSANVNNGAKTRWANFFHGAFLLLAVLLITPVIELIPNAALAAMLIGVGYRLASPAEFIKTYKIGSEQIVIFVATVIVTLAEDLLIGVGAGIFVKLIIEIYYFYFKPAGSLFRAKVDVVKDSDTYFSVKVKDAAVFLNYLGIKKYFDRIPLNANVRLDMSAVKFIDHSFLEQLYMWEADLHSNGGHLQLVGIDTMQPLSSHPLASRRRIEGQGFVKPIEQMDKRQLALKSFAGTNGLQFEQKPTFALIRIHYLPFSLVKKAEYAENVVIGSKSKYQFFFSDIFVQEANFIVKPQFKMTILMVHDYQLSLPDFTLEKEGLFYNLRVLAGTKDINFTDYPFFSKKYFLSGSDEVAVRETFNPEVIRLLEKNTDYVLECRNNRLLIYKDTELLSTEEMEQALNFADELMAAVKSRVTVI